MNNNKKYKKNIRYRNIIISAITLLLVVLAVLGLNFSNRQQSEQETNRLELIHELHNLTQLVTQGLLELKFSEDKGHRETEEGRRHIRDILQTLKTNSGRFNHDLNILNQGGSNVKIGNLLADVPALTSEDDKANLKDISRKWDNYTRLINHFLLEEQATKTLNVTIVTQALQSNQQLQTAIDSMISQSRKRMEAQGERFRLIQTLGILGVVIGSLFFLAYFIRKLRLMDKAVTSASHELSEMMSSVNEGLFWVNKDLKLGEHYSERLEILLDKPVFQENTLEELLFETISADDWATTQKFIKQMFNQRVKEKLIRDLNPLDRVKTQSHNTKGIPVSRYLHFNFTRAYDNNKAIKHLLVSVSDVTSTVDLEAQLKRQREQNLMQLDLLTSIIHVDKDMLDTFILHAYNITERINDILKQPDKKQDDLYEKTKEILREVHGLKGEASVLELDHFVLLSEKFEDQLVKLKNNLNLTGNDFLPLTANLERLIDQLTRIDLLSRRLDETQVSGSESAVQVAPMSPLQQVTSPEQKNNARSEVTLTAYFTKLVKAVSKRNDKQARLETVGLRELSQNQTLADDLNDVIIQLLRNAVVHGIETPEQRRAMGKNETGTIILKFVTARNAFILSVEDDGGGINYEKIRRKMLINGIATMEEAKTLSQKQLTLQMFESGFSTQTKTSQDAGRGIGLDIIKSRIDKMKGKIQINTQKNTSTHFVIKIPK